MSKKVLTVTLNPAVDRTVTIPGFIAGGCFIKQAEEISAGGKGVNVARALRVLDVPHLATGIIGGCSGRVTLLELMRQEGINQDFYRFGGCSRTNLTILDGRTGRTTQILETGPKITVDQYHGFLEKYCSKLRDADFIVISGRLALGLKDGVYADLIQLARRQEIPVFLDTHGAPFARALMARPFAVAPNHKEARGFLGYSVGSASAWKRALRTFHGMGVARVFITLGQDGAAGYDGQLMWRARAPRIKAVNDVGCGDAFAAGVVSAIRQGQSFREVLATATASASASALTVTPGLFDLKDFARLRRKVKVELL